MQLDAGATSKVRAAVKGEAGKKRKTKKKVPAIVKKAEKPSVWRSDGTMKETRRPAPIYKLTIPVNEDLTEFRQWWMELYGKQIVSMDQRTNVPSVRLGDDVPFEPVSTLQFFEVKISSEKWPLHVYGFIATRDSVDYKRNIIFERTRDDCQIIYEQTPYLSLTGPARAVALVDPVFFEVHLQVKGTGQSEDYDLISLAQSFRDTGPLESSLFKSVYTGKISKLEMTFGHIIMSVEAAVSMKVISGSWPDGFMGIFSARTASINDMAVVLLVTGDDGLPLADDGVIKFQRDVVSAEIMEGEHLEVCARALGVGEARYDDSLFFKPQERGKLSGTLTIDSCEIEVTVSWYPVSWW
ncbi:uncharacterized protein [Lolium perenne]|uniref:uncharacterized protein n=1 Tax=Lolium perenne TaxID=4522 RepID=UPI0021E9F0A2|nr:uncharacterized protein LOC127336284 [Lolium perenne]